MDLKDLKLENLIRKYIIGTEWQFRKPNEMSREELSQMMKEVIDYGVRIGVLEEIETKGDKGFIFKVL